MNGAELGQTSIEMAGAVKKHDMGKVSQTVIDNDLNIKKILQREGISSVMTKKSGDTIKAGIDLINAALRTRLKASPAD